MKKITAIAFAAAVIGVSAPAFAAGQSHGEQGARRAWSQMQIYDNSYTGSVSRQPVGPRAFYDAQPRSGKYFDERPEFSQADRDSVE